MLEIDPRARFGISKNIRLKAIPESDQYYAFDIESGDHFSLNRTAYWVLERISSDVDLASLLADFGNEFGLEREEALKDLTELLGFVFEKRIIIRRHNNET